MPIVEFTYLMATQTQCIHQTMNNRSNSLLVLQTTFKTVISKNWGSSLTDTNMNFISNKGDNCSCIVCVLDVYSHPYSFIKEYIWKRTISTFVSTLKHRFQ